MRVSNQIVARALEALAQAVKPGVTTLELDRIAEEFLRQEGAVPAFKGYKGYAFALCASVNEEVVHGIPSERALVEGDIVSLDMGAIVDGYYGDGAVTLPVGTIAPAAERLLRVTREALDRGVRAARRGARLGDISHAV
jgi:methionyl aminopeptidase